MSVETLVHPIFAAAGIAEIDDPHEFDIVYLVLLPCVIAVFLFAAWTTWTLARQLRTELLQVARGRTLTANVWLLLRCTFVLGFTLLAASLGITLVRIIAWLIDGSLPSDNGSFRIS